MNPSTMDSLIAQWDYCNGDVCQRRGCKRCKRAEEFCAENRKEPIWLRVQEALSGGKNSRKRGAA